MAHARKMALDKYCHIAGWVQVHACFARQQVLDGTCGQSCYETSLLCQSQPC